MKCSKTAGPSGIIAEMLKAAGENGVEMVRQLTEAVLSCSAIPSVMKLLERVLDFFIPEMVNIDEMQFGFVPGRGTTDTIFIVCQLQEKYITAEKILYFASIDLEKAFNRMPRRVLWWALRNLGVEEWAVHVIQGMHSNAWSRVWVRGQYSEEFGMGVGVNQGSVLSPLIFILVLEGLSPELCTSVPWEFLYADDLVLIVDTQEDAWK